MRGWMANWPLVSHGFPNIHESAGLSSLFSVLSLSFYSLPSLCILYQHMSAESQEWKVLGMKGFGKRKAIWLASPWTDVWDARLQDIWMSIDPGNRFIRICMPASQISRYFGGKRKSRKRVRMNWKDWGFIWCKVSTSACRTRRGRKRGWNDIGISYEWKDKNSCTESTGGSPGELERQMQLNNDTHDILPSDMTVICFVLFNTEHTRFTGGKISSGI